MSEAWRQPVCECGHKLRKHSSHACYGSVPAEEPGKRRFCDCTVFKTAPGIPEPDWQGVAEDLLDAVETYLLWQPGKYGHATAHGNLATAASLARSLGLGVSQSLEPATEEK